MLLLETETVPKGRPIWGFLPFAAGRGQNTWWPFLCGVPRACSQANPEQDDLRWPRFIGVIFWLVEIKKKSIPACGYTKIIWTVFLSEKRVVLVLNYPVCTEIFL